MAYNTNEISIYQKCREMCRKYNIVETQDSDGVSIWVLDIHGQEQLDDAVSRLTRAREELKNMKLRVTPVGFDGGNAYFDVLYHSPNRRRYRKRNTYIR